MLIDKLTHKKSLAELWHRVFGDSYSFIDLIFKPEYEKDILCFGELDGEKAVSAFYLIKNKLKYEGKLYSGYYLYAAATLPEYRKSGFMSALIKEAQVYCRENGVDFISLVPSQESLYSYYARFGFQSAMYRTVSNDCDVKKKTQISTAASIDAEELGKIRKSYEGNIMLLEGASLSYAVDCFNASDVKINRLSEDGCYIFSAEDNNIIEFASSKENFAVNCEMLKSEVSEDVIISSPFELEFCKCNNKKSYGMLYPININLEREWSFTDIYMNLALD